MNQAHHLGLGLMAAGLGLLSLWIAGREMATGRAEHVTLFFRKQRISMRQSQPLAFWLWVACHGLGGLAMTIYGAVLI